LTEIDIVDHCTILTYNKTLPKAENSNSEGIETNDYYSDKIIPFNELKIIEGLDILRFLKNNNHLHLNNIKRRFTEYISVEDINKISPFFP
jgi:hypothetical protein